MANQTANLTKVQVDDNSINARTINQIQQNVSQAITQLQLQIDKMQADIAALKKAVGI